MFSWSSLSIGGVSGSVIAAIVTESYEPKYCFLYSSLMGLVMTVVAYKLNIQIEKEGISEDEETENRSFCQEFKRSFKEIKMACQMPEYYRVILYLFMGAVTQPTFSTFGYYFLLDEVKVSKSMYAMLTVVGYICLLIGSQIFNKCLIDTEYRLLIIIDVFITIVFAPIQLIFVCRWNLAWGISDMYFVFFLDVIDEIIS